MKVFDPNRSHVRMQEAQVLNRQEELEDLVQEIRIENEDIVKRKEMNEFLFGDFVCDVPLLKLDRLLDDPLPSSYAAPFESNKNERVSKSGRFILSGYILKFHTAFSSSFKESKISEKIRGKSYDGRMLPEVSI